MDTYFLKSMIHVAKHYTKQSEYNCGHHSCSCIKSINDLNNLILELSKAEKNGLDKVKFVFSKGV